MDSIIRGTNACIVFDLSQENTADLAQVTAAELDIVQDGAVVVRKTMTDLDIDTDTKCVVYTCSQEETLLLRPDTAARITLIIMIGGLRREARPVLTVWVEDTPLNEVMDG